MGKRNRKTRIQCVNCNICVIRLCRYPVLSLDSKVRSVICSWLTYPQVITQEAVICKACYELATSAVNQSVKQEDSSSGEKPAKICHKGHFNLCLLCGCSILRKQNNKILKESPTDLQSSITAIIESKVAPRQISESDRVCQACWLRVKREVQHMKAPDDVIQQTVPEVPNVPEDQPQSVPCQPTVITLPNYRRAASTTKHCVFPHCCNAKLRTISDKLRATILSTHNYYIPELARICDEHLQNNTWDTLFDSENSFSKFTVRQIEHAFSLVNAVKPSLDFNNIEEMDDQLFAYLIGHTKEKFKTLLEGVPRVTNMRKGKLGLAMLLLKLRTGDPNERIAKLINMPRRTLETLMAQVREVLIQDCPNVPGINKLSENLPMVEFIDSVWVKDDLGGDSTDAEISGEELN